MIVFSIFIVIGLIDVADKITNFPNKGQEKESTKLYKICSSCNLLIINVVQGCEDSTKLYRSLLLMVSCRVL